MKYISAIAALIGSDGELRRIIILGAALTQREIPRQIDQHLALYEHLEIMRYID
jgi:hypothetical protein